MANYSVRHNIPSDVMAFTHDQETKLLIGNLRQEIEAYHLESTRLVESLSAELRGLNEQTNNSASERCAVLRADIDRIDTLSTKRDAESLRAIEEAKHLLGKQPEMFDKIIKEQRELCAMTIDKIDIAQREVKNAILLSEILQDSIHGILSYQIKCEEKTEQRFKMMKKYFYFMIGASLLSALLLYWGIK